MRLLLLPTGCAPKDKGPVLADFLAGGAAAAP